MAQVHVRDTNHIYDELRRAVVITDDAGNEYRITVNENEGIIINKLGAKEDQICIFSRVANEIIVK